MRNVLMVFALVLTFAGMSSLVGATEGADPTTLPDIPSLKPKPSPRAFNNPYAAPRDGAIRGSGSLAAAAPDLTQVTPAPSGVARLADPVLQWLPEITDASVSTGTPRSLIAGVMQLESSGDPTTVSVAGAQGLMQVMPAEFGAKRIPSDLWQDPATNIMTGARILAERSGAGWEAAVAYYFGIGCDAYGTCTHQYATVVLGWANYYAVVLGDPYWYDVARIPADPAPPPSAPTESPALTPTSTPSRDSIGEPTIVVTTTPTAPPEPTTLPTEAPPLPTAVPSEETTTTPPTEEAAAPETTPGDLS